MPKPMVIGDQVFDATKIEEMGKSVRRWDFSYVPGYSETRAKNEHRAARGEPIIEQDRLQWMRATKADGKETDLRDRGEYARLGYQFATEDDLKERGWGLPPTAHIAPDGTIRREDSVLMIVGKQQARLNREEREREAAEFYGDFDPADYAREGVGVAPGGSYKRVSLADLEAGRVSTT